MSEKIFENLLSPGNSICCKWIWSFAKIILSPREPNVASGYARTLLSIRCKWLVQMQALAEKLSLEHTLHSLQALVNYYYRVKKQRLRKMGLCLLVGRFGGLVSSSIMLLPLYCKYFRLLSGGLLPCPNRTFAGLDQQMQTRHLPKDICRFGI